MPLILRHHNDFAPGEAERHATAIAAMLAARPPCADDVIVLEPGADPFRLTVKEFAEWRDMPPRIRRQVTRIHEFGRCAVVVVIGDEGARCFPSPFTESDLSPLTADQRQIPACFAGQR